MVKETERDLNNVIKPTIERNLISICLKNPDNLIEIKNKEITSDMFLISANKYIFQAIDYLFYKKQEPTSTAIMEVLANANMKHTVEEFGGVEYLEALKTSYVSDKNIDIFCEKLKQAYTRKSLIEICDGTKEFLLSDKSEVMNPTELVGEHEKEITKLVSDVQQTSEVYKMGEDIDDILEYRKNNPNSVPGLELGWNKLDYYTNGGQAGDLIILCARAKTGKSTMLTNWAKKLSIDDELPILYIDTEMSSREQEDRLLSILSGIPAKEIVSGMFVLDTENGRAEDKMKAIDIAKEKMKKGNYFHVYMPNFTLDKINAISKKFKQQYNIQALFVDYIKFPSSQIASLKTTQEWQMLGYLTSGLKDIAGTLKLPVYAGCQENRSNPNSTKKDETNVGGSDRILQLATKLMFLTNKPDEQIIKEGNLKGNQMLQIAFQRNGESNCPPIDIQFDKTILTQKEI